MESIKIIKKLVITLLILIICLSFLTGCYSSFNLETFAYAVAIGLDKGENDTLKLTLQLATLDNSTQGGSRFIAIRKYCFRNSRMCIS